MKFFLQNFLLNLTALWVTSKILPGFTFNGGFKALAIGAVVWMFINLAIIPLLRVMFLPLNLLTLGLFTWVINVIGLYFLTAILPQFKLLPYHYPGANIGGVIIPSIDLNVLYVAIVASFLIGFISHFLQWLIK